MTTLLTSLGTDPRDTTYALGDLQATARFSAISLFDVLPAERRPDRVAVLLTPEAKALTWPEMRAEWVHREVAVVPIDIPSDASSDDLRAVFEAASSEHAVPAGEAVHLDLTAGFRHVPFLFYAVALYLETVRDVRVEGAWYGMWRKGRDVTPLLELTPLVQLADWLFAVRTLRETGSTGPLARLLADRGEASLAAPLRHLAPAYDYGLPIEVGQYARRTLDAFGGKEGNKLRRNDAYAADAIELALAALEPLALPRPEGGNAVKNTDVKRSLAFDAEERARQQRLVSGYLERSQDARAASLLREWVTSLAAHPDGWLDKKARLRASRRLGALLALSQRAEAGARLSEPQREFAALWAQVRDLRNLLQHAGMKGEWLDAKQLDCKRGAVEALVSLLDKEGLPSLDLPSGGGTTLVVPVGFAAGAPWSALRHAQPHRVIALVSPGSTAQWDRARAEAAFSGETILWTIDDPFNGFEAVTDSIRRMRRPEADSHLDGTERAIVDALVDADHVRVCLTGGTTLLGFVASELGAFARDDLQGDVRRFALIDERDNAAQRSDPFVLGRIAWVDPE